MDHSAAQEVRTVRDEALVGVHDVEDDRRRVLERLVVHEIDADLDSFHEDRIHVVLNHARLTVIARSVEDLNERVRAAVAVGSRQVFALEDEAA